MCIRDRYWTRRCDRLSAIDAAARIGLVRRVHGDSGCESHRNGKVARVTGCNEQTTPLNEFSEIVEPDVSHSRANVVSLIPLPEIGISGGLLPWDCRPDHRPSI